MRCRALRDVLHREVESLDEAARLQLDDHLAGCARCRGDRERLRLLRQVATSLPVPPAGSREYGRAIARALLDGRASAPAPVRAWPRRAAIAAAAAAAAIAAVALIARGGDPPGVARIDRASSTRSGMSGSALSGPALSGSGEAPAGTPAVAASPGTPAVAQVAGAPRAPAPADEVSAGEGVVEDGALIDRTAGRTVAVERGAAIPPDTALHAAHPARLRFAAVHVVVAASSELRWSAAARTLVLVRGSLEVDGAGAGVARVVTERFEVELGDVALTVDAGAVRVHRGRARIVDRARTPLAHVESGATWRPPVATPVAAAPEAAPASAAGPSATAPGPSAAALLADARAQLAAQDYAAAERTAERALATSPSRGDAAEARIFLADLAQASGALDRAVTRYLAVAAEFADLPVAESALYAAARVELRRSRTGAARAVLERYLARYPAGRYADDARRELALP